LSSNLSSFRALVICAPSKLSSVILVTVNGLGLRACARVDATSCDEDGVNAAANSLLCPRRVTATRANIDDLRFNTVMVMVPYLIEKILDE
jgi:hypothetical protein